MRLFLWPVFWYFVKSRTVHIELQGQIKTFWGPEINSVGAESMCYVVSLFLKTEFRISEEIQLHNVALRQQFKRCVYGKYKSICHCFLLKKMVLLHVSFYTDAA